MSNRGIMMQLNNVTNIPANSYIPFNLLQNTWASEGSSYYMSYDESLKRFMIPIASANDYYLCWELTLKSCTGTEYPIAGIEYRYADKIRTDYMLFPLRTLQLKGFSLYHAPAPPTDDILQIGLKLVGEESTTFTLHSVNEYAISAHISIIGV